MIRPIIPLMLAALAAVATVSCQKAPDSDASKAARVDFLARVGRNTFTRADLIAAMPGGLSPEDSTKFARFYIRRWIDRQLANDIARNEIDMTEIDRLVDDYRHELIMRRYVAEMYQSHADTAFTVDTLKAYYDANKTGFVLQRPLVKGIYLKIPADAPNLPAIRRLYRSTRPSDIDRLEKEVVATAIHYDYFRDRWIDWEQVEKRVPYDFGPSADAFLKANTRLDTGDGEFVYLLEISEYLPSGAIMPFEAAEPLIRNQLMARRRREYESTLRDNLYDRALSTGHLKLTTEI